jgi:starch synthase
MKILMVAGEVAPYAKTGGLGEVMAALPRAVHRLGHDVRVYMPLHGTINRQQYPMVPIGQTSVLTVLNEPSPINFHASILGNEVPIYFLESERYFPQSTKIYNAKAGNLPYYAFNVSLFQLLETLDWIPDVIHCHDWHSGIIPNFIKSLPASSPYKTIATVETIHNSAFVAIKNQFDIPLELQDQGVGPLPTSEDEVDRLSFLKRGIVHADMVTTVSERYAQELLVPETSHGLYPLLEPRSRTFYGIRNGVDYSVWNPMFDKHLPVNYDLEIMHRKYDNKRALQHRLGLPINDTVPILGMNSRVTEQKGFSLVFEIVDELMKSGVQIVIVGDGGDDYTETLQQKMKEYPKQIAYRAYSEELGSLVYAGSDIFLMPSLFEPMGVGQLYSLRYGTIPVVRSTGGLADTITDYTPHHGTGNGFVFHDYRGDALADAISRALDVWQDKSQWWGLMLHGMALSYSWEIPAQKYVRIYRAAMKEHQGLPWKLPKRW